MKQLNQQNSLDNMIPLTEFSDEESIKDLKERGYSSPYTADSWKQAFPEIDPKYIMCSQGIVFPSSLYYYNPEHYICFEFFTCDTKILRPSEGESFSDCFLRIISKLMNYYKQRDYDRLLNPVRNEENGGIVIHILRNMLEHEKPNSELYNSFISTYALCTCGSHLLDKNALQKLMLCKNVEQKSETKEKLKSFGDVFTVYRGQASDSTPFQNACSWTTNINAAYFFASWRSTEDSCVYTGTIRKADIIEYLDDTSEKEVLVLPGTVTDVHNLTCVDLDFFSKIVTANMVDRKHRFPKETFPQNIQDKLTALYDDNSICHGIEHSYRVAMLTNFIYRSEILLPLLAKEKGEYMKAYHLYSDLIMAVIYHDAGRMNELSDEDHGIEGYRKYVQDYNENKVVEFFIVYHCKSDDVARDFWSKTFHEPDNKLIWKAFCILKDADALDRVRFHFGDTDCLDVNQLRTKTAKLLVPIAYQLVHMS